MHRRCYYCHSLIPPQPGTEAWIDDKEIMCSSCKLVIEAAPSSLKWLLQGMAERLRLAEARIDAVKEDSENLRDQLLGG